MTHSPAARVLLAGLALAVVLFPSLALAAPPAHQRDFFSDYSGKVPPAEAEQIDQSLEKASKASGIHAVLVVVQRMSDHQGMPSNARDFAYTLAKEWKVGNARNGKGMLLLFSLGDKKFHAVKTKNLPVALTDKIAGAMKGEVTLALGEGEIAAAMKKAAEQIAANLPPDGAAPAANPSAGSSPPREQFTPVSRAPQGQSRQQLEYDKQTRSSGSWGWVILIVGGIILVIIIISVVSAFSSARSYGGGYAGGYGGYGHGYGGYGYGGGGDMFTGMMLGSMMGNMFGGGRSVQHHYHGSATSSGGQDLGSSGSSFGSWGGGDNSGGGWDSGGSFTSSDGGGFSSFGGGDFSGGSSGGEW